MLGLDEGVLVVDSDTARCAEQFPIPPTEHLFGIVVEGAHPIFEMDITRYRWRTLGDTSTSLLNTNPFVGEN